MKNSTASFGMIVAAGEAAKRAARLASSIAEVACADLPLRPARVCETGTTSKRLRDSSHLFCVRIRQGALVKTPGHRQVSPRQSAGLH